MLSPMTKFHSYGRIIFYCVYVPRPYLPLLLVNTHESPHVLPMSSANVPRTPALQFEGTLTSSNAQFRQRARCEVPPPPPHHHSELLLTPTLASFPETEPGMGLPHLGFRQIPPGDLEQPRPQPRVQGTTVW